MSSMEVKTYEYQPISADEFAAALGATAGSDEVELFVGATTESSTDFDSAL